MKSLPRLLLLLLAFAAPAWADPPDLVPLWPSGAPDARGTDPEKDVPTLTAFWPDRGTSTVAAVIVCPGGGYGGLAGYEGRDYAVWMSERGIAGFVLKYRLGSNGYRHPTMLHDAQRAIRLLRANAAEWRIDPRRIGIMGSSAGGHLAATAMTHFDAGNPAATDAVERVSSRPDLGILCYPVISMGSLGHGGSRQNLLGTNPAPETVALLSNELQVTKETPPCFVWHTRDDPVVKVQNAFAFAQALQTNGVPYDLHIYQSGPHGMALGTKGYQPGISDPAKLLPWTRDLDSWLRLQGFIRPR